MAIGGILDGGEGGIRLEEVGDDLRSLHLQIVAAQTANSGQNGVSAGADSRKRALAAHSSVWRFSFLARASERYLAASALSLL